MSFVQPSQDEGNNETAIVSETTTGNTFTGLRNVRN